MRYFCTYFDHHYSARGLALYQSLKRHCPEFKLWILCLDEPSHSELTRLNLPEVSLLTLDELERGDPALLGAKENRSRIEYYFTCTPSLPLFILRADPTVDLITYLDADLFFFSSVEPLFQEMEGKSIAIIAHRFTPAFRHWEWNGIFNVGWVNFRRDEHGLACLQWWRERCLEWCYDRIEGNKFADQKYLDDWPTRFPNVLVVQDKGANLAPWNIGNYRISIRDGVILVDEQPLIFFHFHAFQRVAGWIYDTQLAKYRVIPSKVVVQEIYSPYIREVMLQAARLGYSKPLQNKRKKSDGLFRGFARLLKRQYLIVANGRVI